MRKILAACLIFSIIFLAVPIYAQDSLSTEGEMVFYVSPDGSDDNVGSKEAPWKSLYHAAQTLTAGQTAVFLDGMYKETKRTVVKNSGEEGKPITFKAQNPHKAVICYDEDIRLWQKLRIINLEYINLRDFYITQESRAEEYDDFPTLDYIVAVSGSGYCEITGNKVEYAFEDGIKVTASHDILIANNEVSNMCHEGIDIFNVTDAIIRNNKVINCGRVGFMMKGNTRNCLVYNNLVYNDSVKLDHAFGIGGSSDANNNICVAENIGFENYNSIIYNNVVYSKTIKEIVNGEEKETRLISSGLCYLGAKDCHSYNNMVIGCRFGVAFRVPNNLKKTYPWDWNPINTNPVLYNNIIGDCEYAYWNVDQTAPINTVSDYNLFFDIDRKSTIPKEEHSITGDPCFVMPGLNHRLNAQSHAKGAGKEIPFSFDRVEGNMENGYFVSDEERKLTLELIDFAGNYRSLPWDIGVYQAENIVNTSKNSSYTLPNNIDWENAYNGGVVDTTCIGSRVFRGTKDGISVIYRINTGEEVSSKLVTVSENVSDKVIYKVVMLGDSAEQTTQISLVMSDGSTKSFDLKYNVNTDYTGTYEVSGKIDGFSENITVIVTVVKQTKNETINTYKGAEVLLPDGKRLNTEKLGGAYYSTALNGTLTNYTVSVGDFIQTAKNDMDYDKGILKEKQGNVSDGSYLSLYKADADNETVEIVSDPENNENTVLKLNAMGTNYDTKVNFSNSAKGIQKVSAKLKFMNLKGVTYYVEGEPYTIPYFIRAYDTEGTILSTVYFIFYYNADNEFSKVCLRAVSGGSENMGSEIKIDNIITFYDGIGLSEWFDIDFIYKTDNTYDLFVNGKPMIRNQSFYGGINKTEGSFSIGSFSVRRISEQTASKEIYSYVLVDDVTLYQYLKNSNYMVNSIIMTDANDENCQDIISGGMLKSAEINKITELDATAIFALYNASGKAMAIKTVDLNNLSAGTNLVDVNMYFPKETDGGYIIAYIWNYDNIMPLDSTVRFN